MTRFWLFAFETYYPSGGLADRVGMYDTLEEAQAAGRACHRDNWHVYDLQNDKTVYFDWDEPEPVDLHKPSPDDGRPLYMSLPTMTAPHGSIDYGLQT